MIFAEQNRAQVGTQHQTRSSSLESGGGFCNVMLRPWLLDDLTPCRYSLLCKDMPASIPNNSFDRHCQPYRHASIGRLRGGHPFQSAVALLIQSRITPGRLSTGGNRRPSTPDRKDSSRCLAIKAVIDPSRSSMPRTTLTQ